MYKVAYAKTFRKMLKRLRKSGGFNEEPLEEVITLLAQNIPLPPAKRDHDLRGDMQDFRECHIAGDILLLYEKGIANQELTLHKIGTHHEIFGN